MSADVGLIGRIEMEKQKKKIDWGMVSIIAFLVIFVIVMIIVVVLRIWVYMEYGDMPITEVPSWAIPWLT